MMTSIKKDLHLIFIVLIPLIYLGIIYNSLPVNVPLHWDMEGEIDNVGDKSTLIYMSLAPLMIYLIFTIIPKVDPKNRLGFGSQDFLFFGRCTIPILWKHPTWVAPLSGVTDSLVLSQLAKLGGRATYAHSC